MPVIVGIIPSEVLNNAVKIPVLGLGSLNCFVSFPCCYLKISLRIWGQSLILEFAVLSFCGFLYFLLCVYMYCRTKQDQPRSLLKML